MDFADFMREIAGNSTADGSEDRFRFQEQDNEKTADFLLEFQRDCRPDMQPGTLVTWKEGMQNMRMPHPGEPARVLEYRDDLTQIGMDEGLNNASTYLDVVLLIVDHKDGRVVQFPADSRRLRPYDEYLAEQS